MQETWVRSLGWEDPLEKGKYSALENSMHCTVHGILQARILSLLQRIFSTQGSNPVFPHCKRILYQLSQRKPKNTGVGSLSLLQQIFPIQELNCHLLHCRGILYQLSYQGSPKSVCMYLIYILETTNIIT